MFETQVVDNKLKTIITTTTIQVVENSVDLDFLNAQKESILRQKESQTEEYKKQMEARDREVAEVDVLIAECRKAGLKTTEEIQKELEEAKAVEENS